MICDHFYTALLHYPMYNKRMEIVATSITNLDLHDIARTCRTYQTTEFFMVHPVENQQALIRDVMAYWQQGYGSIYNPDRKEAFSRVSLRSDLEEVKDYIASQTGLPVKTIATDARQYPNTVSYLDMRQRLCEPGLAWLLLFGTGWGMTQELLQQCDYILEPIGIDSDYNHLPVRSAVAIILDRLLGEQWYKK